MSDDPRDRRPTGPRASATGSASTTRTTGSHPTRLTGDFDELHFHDGQTLRDEQSAPGVTSPLGHPRATSRPTGAPLHLSGAQEAASRNLRDAGIRLTPGAGTPIVLEPSNRGAKQVIDQATRVHITQNFERVGSRTGDHQTIRELPRATRAAQRALIASIGGLALMAAGAGASFYTLESTRASSGGAFSSIQDLTETLCVYGALPGIAGFWLAWLLIGTVTYVAVEYVTRKTLVAAACVGALSIAAFFAPGDTRELLAGLSFTGGPVDEFGYAARNIPAQWPLLFAVFGLGALASRRGETLPLAIAVILALYFGFELHSARLEVWDALMQEPSRLVNLGAVRGDAADSVRMGIAGSREWLGVRAAGDVVMMLTPAWIFAVSRE